MKRVAAALVAALSAMPATGEDDAGAEARSLLYHGLWAEATWEEWGVAPDGEKTYRRVSRRLVRAGRRWFFFHPNYDRNFFAKEKGG